MNCRRLIYNVVVAGTIHRNENRSSKSRNCTEISAVIYSTGNPYNPGN